MALAKDWVHHLVRSRFNTDFAKMIAEDAKKWAAVVKFGNIKPE